MHVEACLAQDTCEQEEIGDEGALGHECAPLARVSARPRSICRRSPLTA